MPSKHSLSYRKAEGMCITVPGREAASPAYMSPISSRLCAMASRERHVHSEQPGVRRLVGETVQILEWVWLAGSRVGLACRAWAFGKLRLSRFNLSVAKLKASSRGTSHADGCSISQPVRQSATQSVGQSVGKEVVVSK